MTDVEQIWRDKTDDEVAEAASNLSEYTEEAAPVIRAEFQRRGLSEPETDVVVPIPDEDMRCVFVASGLDEANQIVAFLEAAGIATALRGESTTKTHGFTVDGLGRLEVLVRESDEEQARTLLTSADAGEFQLAEGEDVES
ncbi:MAG: putative signal transducing protein [Thermoanaerobaculia bacterium]